MVGRAHHLVTGCGFHVAVIDAPGHGDRPRTAHDEQEVAALSGARAAGEPVGPIVIATTPRWRSSPSRVAGDPGRPPGTPEIGTEGPVGYFGIKMGTAIGVPLTAIEPRITAAVFGALARRPGRRRRGRSPSRSSSCCQWDDEHIPREAGLALFDAFASKEKTLHVYPGGHKEVPWFEAEDSARFFQRHLR